MPDASSGRRPGARVRDEVRNPYELFGVERQPSAIAEPQTFTRPQYEALLRETDVFADVFASTPDVSAWLKGIRREGRLVTGNFFGVLGVSAALGRALVPSDDEPGRPLVISIPSHTAQACCASWRRAWGRRSFRRCALEGSIRSWRSGRTDFKCPLACDARAAYE